MSKILFISLLFCCTLKASSQDTLAIMKRSDFGPPSDYSYQNKWKYFILKQITEIEILYHIPSIPCGGYASSSVTIGRTGNGDTIRILDYCNSNNKYAIGQIIKVAPREKPKHSQPFRSTWVINPKTNLYEPTAYDFEVLNTTWGTLFD